MKHFIIPTIIYGLFVLIGCSRGQKEFIVAGDLVVRQYEHQGECYLVISKASEKSEKPPILLRINKEHKHIDLIQISDSEGGHLFVDLDSDMGPSGITISTNEDGVEKYIVDFGDLGSYDMIVDAETGNVDAVLLLQDWRPARKTKDGIEIDEDGGWIKVEKTDKKIKIKEGKKGTEQ